MTQDRPKKAKKRGIRLFSSIGAKIMLILLTLGATSALGGVLVTLVFTEVSGHMRTLSSEKLPRLETSNQLGLAADRTKDAMAEILLANDTSELTEAEAAVASAALQLEQATAALPPDLREGFETEAAEVAATLQALLDARNSSVSALVNYNLARLDLFLDMELLDVDEDGLRLGEFPATLED